MSHSASGRPSIVHGIGRLAFDAVEQLADIVEAMHATIAAAPLPFGAGTTGRTRGITGFVYRSIRLVNRTARATLDLALRSRGAGTNPAPTRPRSDALLSALNGVLGDHLARSRNPLAIPMQLRRDGQALLLEPSALVDAVPAAGSKLLVLVHGLCMSDRHWTRNGHDHGAALAHDLGYTPLYLLYNTGRHTSENGRELAGRLEGLLRSWPIPVEELAILAHSMGGLVARSACHYGARAGHVWLAHLRKLVFLGTPHHGVPLERSGLWLQRLIGISPYSAPLARLGMIRSAGITDLRYGNVVDEDWRRGDRFAPAGDRRVGVPLPAGVACHAVAATLGRRERSLADRRLGDGLVPLESALGRHADPGRTLAIPEPQQWVGRGMGHLDLLDRPEVYVQIRGWLGDARPTPAAPRSARLTRAPRPS